VITKAVEVGKLPLGVNKSNSLTSRERYLMKTELKAKFLQHLNQKNDDKGFTLIELLVVIIIIGILSAIALPSFLNQANKAKQSEAKTYVGSMNRAQQAYFTEKGSFTTDIGKLGLGVSNKTTNYEYEIPVGDKEKNINTANPDNTVTLKAYVGGVVIGEIDSGGTTNETTSLAVLCESPDPQTVNQNGVALAPATTTPPTCANGYEPLN